MTIEKTAFGAIAISAMIQGQYIRRLYFGYTRREAMRMFKAETGKG